MPQPRNSTSRAVAAALAKLHALAMQLSLLQKNMFATCYTRTMLQLLHAISSSMAVVAPASAPTPEAAAAAAFCKAPRSAAASSRFAPQLQHGVLLPGRCILQQRQHPCPGLGTLLCGGSWYRMTAAHGGWPQSTARPCWEAANTIHPAAPP
jgi:hypothetical protein